MESDYAQNGFAGNVMKNAKSGRQMMSDFIKSIQDDLGYSLQPWQIPIVNKIIEGKDIIIYPGFKCSPNKWHEALEQRLAALESKHD